MFNYYKHLDLLHVDVNMSSIYVPHLLRSLMPFQEILFVLKFSDISTLLDHMFLMTHNEGVCTDNSCLSNILTCLSLM